MRAYQVFKHPEKGFKAVKDGFSWPGFFFTWLWSLGRLGLVVHSTAGWVDPGFRGTLTLELSVCGPLPIVLAPGDKVAQLCIFRCSSPAERPYGSPELRSRYQGQAGPTPPRRQPLRPDEVLAKASLDNLP